MGILHTFQTANSPKGQLPLPMGSCQVNNSLKNCLEEESPSKISKFFSPSCKAHTVITKELQPAHSVQWVWLMFWLVHWSFYLYLFARSDIITRKKHHMRNAREVIMLHVYLYGNLTCLWLRKNWTKDRGWGGVSGAIFTLLKIEILP